MSKRNTESQAGTGAGNKVWIPDEERGFVLAVVKEVNNSDVTVEIVNEKIEKTLPVGDIHPANPESMDTVLDMARLTHLNEATIIHQLRHRYMQDNIYTYSGLFLVAINPYKRLPIYNPEVVEAYKGKRREEADPHVFSLADTAYNQMVTNKQNQSMLVTGESGAGKTENTKKVIQYLTAIAGVDGGSGRLEQQLLRTNPLLEAFGNAKTLRNDNSSRFGKFIEIDFDASGYIAGCKIQNYLLESTRVVHQNAGERNFHFFYQIIADPACKQKFQLGDTNDFEYVNQSGCNVVAGVDDKKEFQDTMSCMDVIGITAAEKEEILGIVAGILHLGNVNFTKDAKDKAQITDKTSLNLAAKYFNIDVINLEEALIRPTITAGTDRVKTAADVEQAIANRNALAKSTYNRLFDWLVRRINESLASKEEIKNFIGVLDIAGFEIFDVNSFEQLCINYTNEKLQQFFNHTMFKKEQEEYLREQIDWKFMDFGLDLVPTIDLIEKPNGVLSILDNQTFSPGTDEKTLAREIVKNHKEKSQIFSSSKFDETVIAIRHYAGEVSYTTKQWIQKNVDPLNDDCKVVMVESSNKVIQSLFVQTSEEKSAQSQKRGAGARFNTVSTNYKNQLKSLMSVLESTEPHFIRCIVPNNLKRPQNMNVKLVLHQLKCNGVLEGIRIVRKGYPGRIVYKEFEKRHGLLAKKQDLLQQPTSKEKCKLILEVAELVEGKHFKLGTTKVFLKAGVEALIEDRRSIRVAQILVVVQAALRGRLARRQLELTKEKIVACKVVQRNWRAFFLNRDHHWFQMYSKARPQISSFKEDQRRKELQEEFENLKRRRAEEERERKSLEEEKRQLEAEAAKLEFDINAENQTQDKMKNDISNLNKQIREYEELIEGSNKEKRNVDEDKLRLVAQVQEKDARIRAKEEEIFTMAEKQKALLREIENMKKTLQDKDVKGAQLDASVRNAEEELNNWKQKYEKEQQRAVETERIKSTLEEKIRDLTFGSEALARQKLESDNKNRTLVEESAARKKEATDLADQISQLTDNLNALKIQLQTKSDELKSRMSNLDSLELDKKRVDTDINNLNERMNEEQRKRTRLENDLKHAKADQQEHETNFSKFSNEKANLEDQLSKGKDEYNSLKTKLAELHEQNIQLDTKKSNLERDIRELELKSGEEKEVNKQAINRLQQKLEEQSAEFTNTLAELNNQKTNLDRKLKTLDKAYKDLVRNLDEVSKAKEDADATVKKLEADIAELNNQLTIEKKRVSDLEEAKRQADFELRSTKDKIDFLREDSARAEQRYRKVAGELNEAIEKQQQLEKEKEDLSGKATSGDSNLKGIKQDLTNTKSLITQLSSEKDQIGNELKTLNNKVQGYQEQIAQLTSAIKNKSDEAGTLLAQLESEQSQQRNLERKLQQLTDSVKNLQTRVDEDEGKLKQETETRETTQNKVRDLELNIATLNATLEDVSKKVQAAEKQYAKLQADTADANNQVSKLKAEKRDLEGKRESLENQLEELETTSNKAAQSVKDLQAQINDAQSRLETEKQARTLKEQENLRTKAELDKRKEELNTALIKNKSEVEKIRKQIESNEQDHERQLKKLSDDRNDLKRQIKNKSQNKKQDTGVDQEALEKLKREYDVTIAKLTAQLNEQQNIRSELEYKKKEVDTQVNELKNRLDNEERARKKAEQICKTLAHDLDEIKELADEAEELRAEVERVRNENQTQLNTVKGELEKEKEKRRNADDGINNLKKENDQLKQDLEVEKKKEGEAIEKLKAQYESEIADLEAALNKLKREKVNTSKITKKLERENRELSRKLTVESQSKLDVDGRSSTQERDLQKVKSDLEFASKNAIKFESENQRLTRELSEFKDRNNRLDDELANLRDSFMKEKKKFARLQRSYELSVKNDASDDDM